MSWALVTASGRPSLLDQILRSVPRRYRLPPLPDVASPESIANTATALAIAIEQARIALAGGKKPDPLAKRHFVDALARLIDAAMRTESGDPVFQAMVLRHEVATVREYASLSAHADGDRRQVHAAVNAIAHPAKLQRLAPGPQRDALTQLHNLASTAAWSALAEAIHGHALVPEAKCHPQLQQGLQRLLDSPALKRLERLHALSCDELVLQYQSLWDSNGPRSGSAAAAAQGSASQKRGAAGEALATQAIEALARRLNEAESGQALYRVVTSMRVPPSIPGSAARAKSEWDVVLLRQPAVADAQDSWDACLLVEAKASVDAASTDLPRLLRGVRLLADAQQDESYAFETQQGTAHLRGAALSALSTDEAQLARTVLYCCAADAEASTRLLGAASRMQLLSAAASLDYASALQSGRAANAAGLATVWDELLESPQWRPVLNQYPMLRQARELMVNPADLLATIERSFDPTDA